MEQIRSAIFNHKGGAGKSTTAYLLSRYNQTKGRRVLLIDADPQSSTTRVFHRSKSMIASYDPLLLGEKYENGDNYSVQDFILKIEENLDLLPANRNLVACEKIAESKIRKIAKTMLRDLKDYDVIIVDCPPALNSLSALGIFIAQWTILPVEPDFFPYQALQQANETIQDLVDIHDEHKGVIYFMNKIKGKMPNLKRSFQEKYKTDLGDKLMDDALIDIIGINESIFLKKNLFDEKKVNSSLLNFFESLENKMRGSN